MDEAPQPPKEQKVRVGRDEQGRVVIGFTEDPPFYSLNVTEASMLALAILQHVFAIHAARDTVTAAMKEAGPNPPIFLPRPSRLPPQSQS